MKKAIVLLSGGLDSSTCLYWAKAQGYTPLALTFDYGQKHKRELTSAKKIARAAKVPCQTICFTLPWKGSSLLDKKIKLPQNRSTKQMAASTLPSTYVPARNTIFLSFALSFADAEKAGAVVVGANAIDYSGYPDCRPNYMKAMQKVAKLGTRLGDEGKGIEILSPLLHLTKSQIVELAQKLSVPIQYTWSCYSGGAKPCGSCDSCLLRQKGFEQAGTKDSALR